MGDQDHEETHDPRRDRRENGGRPGRRRDALRLASGGEEEVGWVFVHPRCARRRSEDMAEVETMLAAGETEIARDELVWLLSECPDYLDAHLQLALIALEEGDVRLARGHFGRVHELGMRAIDAAGGPVPVRYGPPANAAFWEATKGLVHCLAETGRGPVAREIAARAARLDPTDPLGITAIAARASAAPTADERPGRRRRRRGK